MRSETAVIISNTLLEGIFNVFEAMLSKPFSRQGAPPVQADLPTLRQNVAEYPLSMRGSLPSGGGLAVLLSVPDALKLVSLISGTESTTLGDHELATLQEVAEPCLSSGLTALFEGQGAAVEQPQYVSASLMEPENAGELLEFVSAPATAAPFTFSAENAFDSARGLLLFSDHFARILPTIVHATDPAELAEEMAGKPQLSDSEMSDILSGIGAEPEGPSAAGTAERGAARVPANLDMVLDIRLVATARLGHIEMPISEILALGPGSIIDVGHLVDEPVELLVNNKLIARGDVVVVDERFGLRITEIVSAKERIESMH